MNNTFAERFKSARLLNGFSLQDLADKLENIVTRQALYRYERGEIIPDSAMIAKLSEAMKVKPDYFFRNTQVEIGKIEFRKHSSLSVKEQNKVVEQTREFLSRYLELEEILHLGLTFRHPLKGFGIVSHAEDIKKAAAQLRTAWDLGQSPIFNLLELLEDKQIKVVCIDADIKFDGMQTWVNNDIPVIAYNKNLTDKTDRIRFTLLHELAHLLLQFDENLSHQQIEKLCHQFAASVLLPEELLLKELGEHRNRLSIQELGQIKKQYGISMQAIVMQALNHGIINEHYTKQFFNMMKQMGWRFEEPIAYEGIEESNRFDQLIYRALAEELISMGKAAALKNVTLAEFRTSTMNI